MQSNSKSLQNYAKALLELANEHNDAQSTLEQLQKVVASISPEWLQVSDNPAFSGEQKRLVSQAILKKMSLSATVTAFVVLVVENQRLRFLKQIVRQFKKMWYAQQNKTELVLRSAHALSSKDKQQIVTIFTSNQAGELMVEEQIDPKLIGGVQVQIGSTVYDGSVRGRLDQLKSKLLQG